jgi:prepilin-type N-terminal cleavage/methylation domain-containing protein
MRDTSPDPASARGFTLIEILVVITIIAALAGLVAAIIPYVLERSDQTVCLNNLMQIGGILTGKNAGKGLDDTRSGAAFLLQVADDLNDADLEVFVCPGEPGNPDDPRPKPGSPEFIAMYRDQLDQKTGQVEDRFCSYAGPNLKDYPMVRAGAGSKRVRLWACDKCRNGHAHHDGIVVLHTSSKVQVLPIEDLEGHDADEGMIVVGADSPDPRLRKMTYFPRQ